MRIGIVAHPFGSSSKGLEQYVFETTKEILKRNRGDVQITLYVPKNSAAPSFFEREKIVHLFGGRFWKLFLYREMNTVDAFVFFTESAPLFLWPKSIIVFFDASYVYFSGTSAVSGMRKRLLMWWRGMMLRAARHIVAISESSRDDLIKLFNISRKKITVIYPGFKSLPHAMPGITHPGNYFLYVGPFKERKNTLRVVRAFIEFKSRTLKPHTLVLVGRKTGGSYEKSVLRTINESDYFDSVIIKTTVDDAVLSTLYTGASALVFPSLLEGFGLPILEALSVGCPVITSHTTSTREVAGDAGIFVDPGNTEDIAAAMAKVAEGQYDRTVFLEKAKIQCAKFSWEASGEAWRAMFVRVHDREI